MVMYYVILVNFQKTQQIQCGRPYLSKNVTHSSRTTPYLCYDLTTLEL